VVCEQQVDPAAESQIAGHERGLGARCD
jgi:hypothetical protein